MSYIFKYFYLQYTKFFELVDFIRGTSLNNGIISVYKESLKTVFIKTFLYGHENTMCKMINKSLYEVTYSIHDNEYKIMIRHKNGPPNEFIILDENGYTCTDEILPYMGPLYDFHGIEYSPSDFRKKALKFMIDDGVVSEWGEYDIMKNVIC